MALTSVLISGLMKSIQVFKANLLFSSIARNGWSACVKKSNEDRRLLAQF